MRRFPLFLHSDPPGGAPNQPPAGPTTIPPAPPAPTAPPATPTPTPVSPAKVSQLVDTYVRRHGSPENALQVVLSQLAAYEEREPEVTRIMGELRARIPAGDAIVLAGEEAKAWKVLQGAKLTTEKAVTDHLDRSRKLEGETAEQARMRRDTDAATAGGWNTAVFHDLTAGLEVEMKPTTVKEHGKDIVKNLPHVRAVGDPSKPFEPFLAWAEREKRAYLPALLQPNAAGPQPQGTQPPAGSQPTDGHTRTAPGWPTQQPVSGQPAQGADPTADFLNRTAAARASRPNPLVPKPVTAPVTAPAN